MKMKTQISTIVNGCKDVIRESYGIPESGTSLKEKEEIMQKVFAENGKKLEILFAGERLQLLRKESLSGKSQWYACDLEEAIAGKFVNTDGILKSYSLTINSECRVYISKNVRKNERQTWKLSCCQEIDAAFIKII